MTVADTYGAKLWLMLDIRWRTLADLPVQQRWRPRLEAPVEQEIGATSQNAPTSLSSKSFAPALDSVEWRLKGGGFDLHSHRPPPFLGSYTAITTLPLARCPSMCATALAASLSG